MCNLNNIYDIFITSELPTKLNLDIKGPIGSWYDVKQQKKNDFISIQEKVVLKIRHYFTNNLIEIFVMYTCLQNIYTGTFYLFQFHWWLFCTVHFITLQIIFTDVQLFGAHY